MTQVMIDRTSFYRTIFPGKKGLVFLDLGANVGIVSLYAQPACSRIIAVEPEPEAFRALSRITHPPIECIQCAVVAQDQDIHLGLDLNDLTCHSVVRWKKSSVLVPGRTLEAIFKQNNLGTVDVCKVDIEGSEMDVLSKEVIKLTPIRKYYVEAHPIGNTARQQNGSELINRFKSCGFTVSRIPAGDQFAFVAERPKSTT